VLADEPAVPVLVPVYIPEPITTAPVAPLDTEPAFAALVALPQFPAKAESGAATSNAAMIFSFMLSLYIERK
jgi:hypothetical protein